MTEKKPIYFDIETGGLNPSGSRASSLLSISHSRGRDVVTTYSNPVHNSWLSKFSEENILPQLRGKELVSEKESIERFIGELQANRGSPLIGYNIEKYDIGFLRQRAQSYGLGESLDEALRGREKLDVAYKVKEVIARETERHALTGTFDDILGMKYSASIKQWAGKPEAPESFKTLRQAIGYNHALQMRQPASKLNMQGWTLENTYNVLKKFSNSSIPDLTGVAHESATDVRMTQILHQAAESGELEQVFRKPDAAQFWLNQAAGTKIAKAGRPADAGKLWKTQGASNFTTRVGAGTKMLVGLSAVTAATGLAWLAYNGFSAKDDVYNNIEGLPHGGQGQEMRRAITSFGSGWQGLSKELPSQLMGINIDPEILAFRKNVIDDADERRQLQQELRAREKEATAELGSFNEDDLTAVTDDTARVNLSDFDIRAEDADTLILERGGEEIQVRLAGIDAPESGSHSDDALAPVRIWQDQPHAAKSTQMLEQLMAEQNNLSLLISTGKKTYGRYLGVLEGDSGASLNKMLVERGAVTALPFGNIDEDLISRDALRTAENKAVAQGEGLWALKRYQAVRATQQAVGRPITHNTLTRIDKLAENLNTGAYASWLESFGEEEGTLSSLEQERARRVGRVLSRRFGGTPAPNTSGNDEDHVKVEGLGHEGIAWQVRQSMTPFGSGWDALRNLTKQGEKFEDMIKSKEFKEALSQGQRMLRIGEKSAMGEAFLMQAKFRDKDFTFVRKIGILGEHEASTMRKFQDSFAPTMYRTGTDKGSGYRYIDMELFVGKEARNMGKAGNLTQEHVRGLESALDKMHQAGYGHGDPHYGNWFVTNEGNVGVIDFGAAGPLGEYMRVWKRDGNLHEAMINNQITYGKNVDIERLNRARQAVGLPESPGATPTPLPELKIQGLPPGAGTEHAEMVGSSVATGDPGTIRQSVYERRELMNKKLRQAAMQRDAARQSFHNAHNGGKKANQ